MFAFSRFYPLCSYTFIYVRSFDEEKKKKKKERNGTVSREAISLFSVRERNFYVNNFIKPFLCVSVKIKDK